jgi:hypothetical protein
MPSCVSGNPTRVSFASLATMKSHASESSHAPPGTAPPTAATLLKPRRVRESLAMRPKIAWPMSTKRCVP